MHYIVRPGVQRLKICDTWLLVPDRAASEACPYVRRINLLLSAALELIEKGRPLDNAYEVYRVLSKRSVEEARRKVDDQLADLCDKGFLIAVEDEA